MSHKTIVCREDKGEPHIMNIERIYKDPNGDMWLYGGWFYRPHETFHLASKKFLSKVCVVYLIFDFCNNKATYKNGVMFFFPLTT